MNGRPELAHERPEVIRAGAAARMPGTHPEEKETAMPFSVGPMELVIVLVIALVVLGPKRLPEAGRAVGKGMREFKDSISGAGSSAEEAGEIPASVRADEV
jgi:sec-independent protein translocase protein TatA